MRKTIPPELEGEYIIRVMDSPDGSNGFVVYDDDDFANVYVNARLNKAGQHKAADHEMEHIINDDIHNDDDIKTIEARANNRATQLKSIPRLMKARDLMPKKPKMKLTRRQTEILKQCLNTLDAAYFKGIE